VTKVEELPDSVIIQLFHDPDHVRTRCKVKAFRFWGGSAWMYEKAAITSIQLSIVRNPSKSLRQKQWALVLRIILVLDRLKTSQMQRHGPDEATDARAPAAAPAAAVAAAVLPQITPERKQCPRFLKP
jgi:hypothetical protein